MDVLRPLYIRETQTIIFSVEKYQKEVISYYLFLPKIGQIIQFIGQTTQTRCKEMNSDYKCSEELEQITQKAVKSLSLCFFRAGVRPTSVRNRASVLSPQTETLTMDMGYLFQSSILFTNGKIENKKNQIYCSNFTETESQDQNENIGLMAGIAKKFVN